MKKTALNFALLCKDMMSVKSVKLVITPFSVTDTARQQFNAAAHILGSTKVTSYPSTVL